MSKDFKSYFNIPDMDFSELAKPITDEESAAAMVRMDRKISREERLAFVEQMETHPEALTVWDMPITFDEYARRVRTGEYDAGNMTGKPVSN